MPLNLCFISETQSIYNIFLSSKFSSKIFKKANRKKNKQTSQIEQLQKRKKFDIKEQINHSVHLIIFASSYMDIYFKKCKLIITKNLSLLLTVGSYLIQQMSFTEFLQTKTFHRILRRLILVQYTDLISATLAKNIKLLILKRSILNYTILKPY